ncbi:EAL domain-containing protein [Lichenihabitans sp. PAMC28606]|uniref:putative bifunctional diguanylate cyclase/phosphodiesterase n=1 Tax=Lichenihabitans sp. PAMC28606 TaxID=2880932 RepID=UPI001D0A016D|nr:EAL domain-containing protein [Lichenihabitans sp. PAMC28606]UDL95485.1 EAL domain-containing protein [Lichenihabitans sp. PAMC28606]
MDPNLQIRVAETLIKLRQLILVLISLSALSVLVALGWRSESTQSDFDTSSQRSVRAAELIGDIAYLGESLSMSAQMTASSGERRWAARYEEVAPKLDVALSEAVDLAAPDVRLVLASTTSEAHRNLVSVERRALTLSAQGDLAAAQTLLNGPEYHYLQDVYASGMEVFGQELKEYAYDRRAALKKRLSLENAGFLLSAVLLVASMLLASGRLRLQKALTLAASIARTDPLTELPNRRKFYEDVALALPEGNRKGFTHALLFVDLDRFKAANDAHGHKTGDKLLQQVAVRLRDILRPGDMIARLGGDEFALLVQVASDERLVTEAATSIAQRITVTLAEPFKLSDGLVITIGASVGIAIAQAGDVDYESLIHRADLALYQAKAEGRGCVRVFEAGMDDKVRTRAQLALELTQAVAADEIVPHYQPLINLQTGRVIGVEMLARWPHPRRGMVSPAEFIPMVEELGLIVKMTESLMCRACKEAATWRGQLTLACNISPAHLRDLNLPTFVRKALENTGFPADRLEIEVTESAFVGDIALARLILDQIKALGVKLALDDFGTGYSSLKHLQSLPFDKLKIDASFVGAMVIDKESAKIVAAVVGLGQSLGLSTVAEGVETEETAAMLRNLGCDIGQGWLFGRPGPAAEIERIMLETTSQSLSQYASI